MIILLTFNSIREQRWKKIHTLWPQFHWGSSSSCRPAQTLLPKNKNQHILTIAAKTANWTRSHYTGGKTIIHSLAAQWRSRPVHGKIALGLLSGCASSTWQWSLCQFPTRRRSPSSPVTHQGNFNECQKKQIAYTNIGKWNNLWNNIQLRIHTRRARRSL